MKECNSNKVQQLYLKNNFPTLQILSNLLYLKNILSKYAKYVGFAGSISDLTIQNLNLNNDQQCKNNKIQNNHIATY